MRAFPASFAVMARAVAVANAMLRQGFAEAEPVTNGKSNIRPLVGTVDRRQRDDIRSKSCFLLQQRLRPTVQIGGVGATPRN